jgi:hypothetical protein
MTGLNYEVWDDPVQNYVRILVRHRRTCAPEDALTRAGRAPAAMWNLCLAESVGDDATDAVVVALNLSALQARCRKKVESVGIDGVGTTPTQARLKVLADVSPQCRNRDTEMQRICCTPYVFLSVGPISSRLYQHHFALSSTCRPQFLAGTHK